MSDVYARLSARFPTHHKDPRGLEYLTGEQVVSRLNDVLGPGGWSFDIKAHGYDQEADEIWACGHLEATIDGALVAREQFGSQKHNRLRSNGKIIDYGFDMKGAATDALKKCATLIGVGLYLAEKEGGVPQQVEEAPKATARDAKAAVAAPATTQPSVVPKEPASAPTMRLTDALGWWHSACEHANNLGLKDRHGKPFGKLPSNATADQVDQWTRTLMELIEKEEAAKETAA